MAEKSKVFAAAASRLEVLSRQKTDISKKTKVWGVKSQVDTAMSAVLPPATVPATSDGARPSALTSHAVQQGVDVRNGTMR